MASRVLRPPCRARRPSVELMRCSETMTRGGDSSGRKRYWVMGRGGRKKGGRKRARRATKKKRDQRKEGGDFTSAHVRHLADKSCRRRRSLSMRLSSRAGEPAVKAEMYQHRPMIGTTEPMFFSLHSVDSFPLQRLGAGNDFCDLLLTAACRARLYLRTSESMTHRRFYWRRSWPCGAPPCSEAEASQRAEYSTPETLLRHDGRRPGRQGRPRRSRSGTLLRP